MNCIAPFIDGAYLEHVCRHVGQPHVDFAALATHIGNGFEVLRTYYYHCLPYLREPALPADRERFSRRHRFFTALSHLPRFQVRLGQLERRGRNDRGMPVFEQKRVDVLTAVDLTLLATKRMITHAAVFAGDSDSSPQSRSPGRRAWSCVCTTGRTYMRTSCEPATNASASIVNS